MSDAITTPEAMPVRIKAMIEPDWHEGETGRRVFGGEWRAQWEAGVEYVRADLAPRIAAPVAVSDDDLLFAMMAIEQMDHQEGWLAKWRGHGDLWRSDPDLRGHYEDALARLPAFKAILSALDMQPTAPVDLDAIRAEAEAVAGAYAASAHCIMSSLDGAGDHPTAQAMRRVYADLANQLFALTPADATAALDRIRAEAVAGAYAAAAEKVGPILKAGRELTDYASYAEMVGGLSVNRPQIRKWCDALRGAVKALPEDDDFEPSILALTPADATAALDRIRAEAVAPLEAEVQALRAQVARVAVSAEYLVDQGAGEFDRQLAMKDIRAALAEIGGGNG